MVLICLSKTCYTAPICHSYSGSRSCSFGSWLLKIVVAVLNVLSLWWVYGFWLQFPFKALQIKSWYKYRRPISLLITNLLMIIGLSDSDAEPNDHNIININKIHIRIVCTRWLEVSNVRWKIYQTKWNWFICVFASIFK